MTLLSFDRYCDQIVEETALLRTSISGAKLDATVPSCPDWTLRDLVHHTGWAHRWVYEIVTRRATGPVAPEDVPNAEGPELEGPGADESAALDAWLAEGADRCAKVLRDAGPDARVWAWAPVERPTAFWARRMTHETVVHRADACLTTAFPYDVQPEVAADALDEWLWLGDVDDDRHDHADLLGAGRTVHLHATDTPAGLNAEWLVDFTGGAATWRRGHEKAAVAVRGPLTDVLLVVYRRQAVDAGNVEVLGDRDLLDQWVGQLVWE
ncbi:maleylpyruvate isomerase family mycothiol-dependent enzyme [Streptomyces sp. NBC_00237]|uniref:maleylpyruvate isomerase family mycothiol-dependent enzyme n=1 Tax=Streptomyces sp. NBC_00237 TaxID=2975687 RepID=UPI00224FF977|nr:maleylpyruvate isomerase family mycothiol-dependent enzyme [Streptomyces sp. NBC_00237]MCX5201541.1 maleylpyruvate isomerase family mycothiol-dependent enzyme [Streptomyces sp. NBC_00237]